MPKSFQRDGFDPALLSGVVGLQVSTVNCVRASVLPFLLRAVYGAYYMTLILYVLSHKMIFRSFKHVIRLLSPRLKLLSFKKCLYMY